jgi:hypothetical protein
MRQSMRAIRLLLNRLGLDGVRLHDLRHFYATELLKAGVHPEVVSEALGHSSVAVNLGQTKCAAVDSQGIPKGLDKPARHCHIPPPRRSGFWSVDLAQGIPRAAMCHAASGGRTVEPVTEEDF